ncbi:hypothetical protein FACS1894120_2140 [Clostridia bacterium]|nr:hypothetical protein FACS1894120_2140 [Clostridia bacterium]
MAAVVSSFGVITASAIYIPYSVYENPRIAFSKKIEPTFADGEYYYTIASGTKIYVGTPVVEKRDSNSGNNI